MSIHIVALGNEKEGFLEQEQQPSSLIWTYLWRSAVVTEAEDSVLFSSASHAAVPAFTEYRACVFGNVRVVVHDCPSWDLFDNDWYSSRNVVGQADVIVIKYAVNDKSSFQEVKDNYAPVVKRILNHWTVPVIIVAVGSKQSEEVPPCTCPLCTSDKGSCVAACEGIQLSKELGATYLELHSLNDYYVGKYFGGVLEYFIIQCLRQKSSEKIKKKKKHCSCHGVNPPQLEQPTKLPLLKVEEPEFYSSFLELLLSCQYADVRFCTEDLEEVGKGHRVILCSVSQAFLLLFGVKTTDELQNSPLVKAAMHLFALKNDPVPAVSSGGLLPVTVLVRDSLLCACLPEILKFFYTGASQWEELEHNLRNKLKKLQEAEKVLEKVRTLVKPHEKLCSNRRHCQRSRHSQIASTSLRMFFNTPVLADVIFKVQGFTIPAHKAILIARCEVMAAMFSGNYAEANNVLVPIHGVSKDTFLNFVEYLYTDICYPVKGLTQLSSVRQKKNRKSSHILKSFYQRTIAQFHNAERLSTWLLHFIASNYLIFSQKPEFYDLSAEEQAFVETHRWPSSMYLQDLANYRKHVHSQKSRCNVM
nr:PREDICTED: rho-related BTB domain-containing protein 3 [Latimeria chalumnae]|eukprot:XP_014340505.1 PREDICTED: rho-related BTB domain-containing protein 3 [Latimeria chalumnae]